MAVQILYELSGGLSAIHERGIVHCDLKLDNVLIDATGAMKIADFGTSMLLESDKDGEKVAEKIKGTLVFQPPEVSIENRLT